MAERIPRTTWPAATPPALTAGYPAAKLVVLGTLDARPTVVTRVIRIVAMTLLPKTRDRDG